MADSSTHVISLEATICLLDCKKPFENLSDGEKLFCHHLSRAIWYGGLILLYQTSPESPGIFLLLREIFRHNTIQELEVLSAEVSLSNDEFKAFLTYTAAVFAFLGNYKSYGSLKIVPAVPKDRLATLLQRTRAFLLEPEAMSQLWSCVSEAMYSLSAAERQLGFAPDGVSTYFSASCNKADLELIQEFLNANAISAFNTRLFKTAEDTYEVRIASALGTEDPRWQLPFIGQHAFIRRGKNITVNVTRGDHAYLMAKAAENLRLAKECALNETQKKMLDLFVESFLSGSLSAHMEGSRAWIQDRRPAVESHIGFLIPYKDPFGVRADFTGFAAVVNREMSVKYEELVAGASDFLELLPWPRDYEVDAFQRPDFTSLDVVSYAGWLASGLNIPYYQEIRQKEGFKNVSFGNVFLSGNNAANSSSFLSPADVKLYRELQIPAFEMQVGLHELFGHGSGKLFMEDASGRLNFDPTAVVHLETGEPLTSWYGPNESWATKFSGIASSYEECKAECVALYLCQESEIVRIFGYEGERANDLSYVLWLSMVHAGLTALEFYNPKSKSWHQPHMQARYAILQVLLEASDKSQDAGQRLVCIDETSEESGSRRPVLRIKLNRSLLRTVGKKAIGDFLRKLQLYKSTADYARGSALYGRYSEVSDKDGMLFATSWRDVVLSHATERPIFVQCNTRLENACDAQQKVDLIEYEPSSIGLIQSFMDRFPDVELRDRMHEMWVKDRAFWPSPRPPY